MDRDSQEGAGLLPVDEGFVDFRGLKPKSRLGRLSQVAIAFSVILNIVTVLLLGILLERPTQQASSPDLFYSESSQHRSD
jgi:hypothetical protein